MPLVPTSDLLTAAARDRTGLAAFNVLHLETAEALVAAAERAGRPVVLQVSQNCAAFHGGLAPIARACAALATPSTARIALHLDHAEDTNLVREAVDLGFGSVMFDASGLPYDENTAATADVTAHAHAHGVLVEAELGEIGGKDGVHAPGVRTDPGDARTFVASTGVDALAVAVGSSHAMTERDAVLDLGLIERLRDAVPVPLVLHGSSGVADDILVAAIAAGMTKINVSTHLAAAFTRAVRTTLEAAPTLVDSRVYMRAGREAVADEAERLLRLLTP
jgi:fructose-bisphosphate aldolase class II